MMRSQLALRLRSSSFPLNAVPPSTSSTDYSTDLADLAARILYRSPLPSDNHLPVFVLNAAAFPDAKNTDYDALLPYVLVRLPDEEELIDGQGYELVFFAGDSNEAATATKKGRPGWGWFFQAYHVLSRAMRKRLQKMYIVHEKNWIRILIEMFSTVVSPKFRKKIVHVSTLTGLALHIPIQDLLIPPSAYTTDRRLSKDIHVPYTAGRRAFAVQQPLPVSSSGAHRLPRVLREATSFVVMDSVIKTEGIFRISPRAMVIDILTEAYDRGQKFIVWREGNVALSHSHRRDGVGEVWVGEMEQKEGYGLHMAAALIKQWYKELREPVFPQTCYMALEKFYGSYGDTKDPLKVSQLLEILSETDKWSPINKTSRKILTMHLLPLLSRVTEFQEWNQMTAYNLAVCFGPCLLHGPDPLEDVRIAGIISRILMAMIMHWKEDLAPKLDMDTCKFEESLRIPEAAQDQEDPPQDAAGSLEAQISGITLVDNDESDEEVEQKPPLPPRPVASPEDASRPMLSPAESFSSDTGIRRKPAPPIQSLPRYSVVVTERPFVMEQMPFYNTVPPDTLEHMPFYNTVPPETLEHMPFYNTVPPETLEHMPFYNTVPPETLEHMPFYNTVPPENLEHMPFYNTVPPEALEHSPFYNTVPPEEDTAPLGSISEFSELPEYEPSSATAASPASMIARKPLPKS